MTQQLEPGALLERRYRIRQLLGHGGMGAVYLAQDTRLDVLCAVKEAFYTTPEALAQFEREAQLLAKLKHPHLPRVTDYFAEQARYYLVMEYIPGEDLLTWRAQRDAPTDRQVIAWACQLLDALAYLHGRQPPVIHRDIKPANIKLTAEGQVVLVDFGIAKVFDPDGLTTTGAKAISPGYSPLEQYAHAQRTDARSDIYSLGATLYYVLTGQCPPEAVERLTGETLPPLQRFGFIDPQLERVIMRALEMDPRRRWSDAAAMRAALETLACLETAPPAPARDAGPSLKLVLDDGREYALAPGQTLRLGRAPDNDVVLREEQLSRHHAEIRPGGHGSVLVDLGSTNHTYVDGHRLTPRQPYPLAPGAQVQLGPNLTLAVASGAAADAPAPLPPEARQHGVLQTVIAPGADASVPGAPGTGPPEGRGPDAGSVAHAALTPRPGRPSARTIPAEFLALGGLAVLVLAVMLVAGVLLLRRGDGLPPGTPAPIAEATSTITPADGDAPGEPDEIPVGQGTPTLAPTFTPRAVEPPATLTPRTRATDTPTLAPTSTPRVVASPATATLQPRATDTPTPLAVACRPQAPRLLEPDPDAAFTAWVDDVTFRWEGGTLCDDQAWVVTIYGPGVLEYYGPTQASELTTKVEVQGADYQWRVEVKKGGQVVQGVMSAARKIVFGNPPGGGDSPPEPTPTDLPPSER